MGLDAIYIRDLHLRCIVGVYERERDNLQDVLINVILYTDLSKAGKTDDIEDTVDYKSVKNRIVEAVEKSRYFLLEALAERISQVCLEEPGVEKVEVTVDKPGALRFARSVAVRIVRERKAEEKKREFLSE